MLTTNTGTVSGMKVIYDKTPILGEGRGSKMFIYLDFTKDGTESPTISFTVKDTNISDNYYTLLSKGTSGNFATIQYNLPATRKVAIEIETGKSVEYVAADSTLFTTSTLIIDFALDNYFA